MRPGFCPNGFMRTEISHMKGQKMEQGIMIKGRGSIIGRENDQGRGKGKEKGHEEETE